MVLKSVPFAVALALVLAWGGVARADDYKPDEYLGLDLSKAVLSPERLGPETQFAPVALEARGGNEAQRARQAGRRAEEGCRRARPCGRAEGRACQARPAARRGARRTRASSRQPARRAGDGHPHPDLAVPLWRHLRLEALNRTFRASSPRRKTVGAGSRNRKPASQTAQAPSVAIRRRFPEWQRSALRAHGPGGNSWSAPPPALAVASLGTLAAPNLCRAVDRPRIAGGIQSGDVSGRLRRGLGARRPSRADAGGMLDRREFSRPSSRQLRAMLCPTPISPQSCSSTICRPARISSTACASTTSRPALPARAAVGHFRTAPAAGQSISFLWSGDVAGQGWGIDARARRLSQLSHHARQSSGFLHPLRRSHLRRLHGSFRAEAAERRDLAQPRDRGKVRSRAHAWRSFAAITNTTISTRIFAPSTPRCRCSRNGTITRSPTTGRLPAAMRRGRL